LTSHDHCSLSTTGWSFAEREPRLLRDLDGGESHDDCRGSTTGVSFVNSEPRLVEAFGGVGGLI
jgi:hypothetical protein